MTTLEQWRERFAPTIIGHNRDLLEAIDTARNVSHTRCPVLISGESGTGKELIARAVHSASDRADGPFVALNCSAIPTNMIESELFGHVRGAFTGASANRSGKFVSASGGTLFLDEIGEMPAAVQAKLLRVLQEGTVCPVGSDDEILVDVRIVAATHRDLDAMIDAGEFRGDLYYRLAVIPVHLPPLRERGDDIDILAASLLDEANRKHGCKVAGISKESMRILRTQAWPGNVRQLGHCIERAVLLKQNGTLTPTDLRLSSQRLRATTQPPQTESDDLDLRSALTSVERSMIDRALDRAGGNRTEAAALLGLNRTTLVEKLRKYAS